MVLTRMDAVFVGVLGMRGRGMGVVGGFLVVARFVVLSGFGVMLGGLGVVGSGVLVAFGGFLRHGVGFYGAPEAVRASKLHLLNERRMK